MVVSPAPRARSTGREITYTITPRTTEEVSSSVMELPMIREASSVSPRPRAMENSGAPPWPNRPAKADRMVITGRATPTPVRAAARGRNTRDLFSLTSFSLTP